MRAPNVRLAKGSDGTRALTRRAPGSLRAAIDNIAVLASSSVTWPGSHRLT